MPQFPYINEPTHDTGSPYVGSTNRARDTSVQVAEGRMIVQMDSRIRLLEPHKSPFVQLLTTVGAVWDGQAWKGSGIQTAETGNPEFSWLEDAYSGRYFKVGSTGYAASGQVDITVTGAGSNLAYAFTPGEIVKNLRTGENMLIDSVQSGTVVRVVAGGRGFGTTSAALGANGDELLLLGNVNAEGTGSPNTNTTRTTKISNVTQIFKTAYQLTGTAKETNLYGGTDLSYQNVKKGTEHRLAMERAFMFGEYKNTTDSAGHPLRATGGVVEFIKSGNSYIQNQNGPITAPDLNTFLRESFTYSSQNGATKILMCGGILMQAINEIARGQILTKPLENSYGMSLKEWVTSFGTVNLIYNPLFVGDLAGMGLILDLNNFKYVSMRNRNTKLLTNIQAPDADNQLNMFMTEAGLQRMQAPTHAMILGVTA